MALLQRLTAHAAHLVYVILCKRNARNFTDLIRAFAQFVNGILAQSMHSISCALVGCMDICSCWWHVLSFNLSRA